MMFCAKMKPSSFLMLTTLILVFLWFFSSPGAADAAENGVVPWGSQRSVLEGINGGNSTSLVLAKDRTHRKDPQEDLKYYTGGWNISNDHYIASVLYTGSTLFLIAAFWFVAFGIFLLLVSMYVCCCRRRRYGYSRFAYALSLVLLTVFTIAAIIGSVILYTGQEKFHDSTKSTLDYVLGQADSTVSNLKNVSNYLTAAKKVGVDQVFLPQDVQNNIDKEANSHYSCGCDACPGFPRLPVIYFGPAVSRVHVSAIWTLVVIGWILIAITFILCGIFLVLHNVMGDTCVAMNEWVNNPTAHTALDDIIPCVDPATAQEALSQSEEVTFQMVRLVNGIIANISNVNLPPNARPLYYNQSGPLVPLLCNPYNADKTDRTCATGEVDLSNATQVWRNYKCQVSSNNICTTVGRLTPGMYDQMSGAVNVSYGLYHYGPFLTNLVDCTFVRETFTTIHKDHCPDLRRYSRWVYIGLNMVSDAVMLSLILWVLYARERRHRKYTKLVDATSAQTSFESK
ncbi:hypothetical protein Sango_1691400 [Sesamum angolense]|uniref:Transmembrane protein n=1 Tax=Sesamum angolense TaxID=2727404 RepID=A0AAE1WL98_9LAMI|nr:hypothetical protein Sango_1691400 [Sesamum angolense]